MNAGRATPGGSGDLERWGIYMGQMGEALGVAVQAKGMLRPKRDHSAVTLDRSG